MLVKARRGPGMHCPHCGVGATARTSVSMSAIYREVTYQCKNLHCGFVWVCGLEALRGLSPPAFANPLVDIPIIPAARSKPK